MTKAAEVEIEKPGKAIAKRANGTPPAPVVSEGDAILQMLERAARDPSVDIDKMQRLMEMRDKSEAQRNERAFNEAMAAAQAEMRPVAADANNTQTKSKYASYAALDRVLRPIYTKHGFALSFNTGDGAPAEHVRVLCDVTNCGHTRHYKIDMPADGKGAKGGDVMTKTHATGSAVQYGMRYLLKMIFNVSVGDADDDGNKAGDAREKVTSEQVKALNDLMAKANLEPQIIFEHFQVLSLEDLTPTQHDSAVKKLNKKLELAR